MAITTQKLWMAPQSNRLLSGPNSFTPANNPQFYQGNAARIELHLVSGAGIGNVPYDLPFPAGAAIQVAVGQVNSYPTGGDWSLVVSGSESGAVTFDATPAQLQSALNALSAVSTAGGVTVSKLGNGYIVTWNTFGSKPTIEVGSDTLTPASYESISLVQAGDSVTRQVVYVELRQNPIALGVDWSPLGNPGIVIDQITAWNGSTNIWRYNITPSPKAGSYILTVTSGSTVSNFALAYNAGASAISNALAAVFPGTTAYQTGETQFDVVFTADVTLTANSSGLIGYNGYIGNLNFATAEVHQFLAGLDQRSATMEVTCSVDGVVQTLLQTNCFVYSDVVSSGALVPLPLGVPLSESVANSRFVRRDVDQSPDSPTQEIIWGNLGVPRPPVDGAYHIFKDNVWETVTIY
jgi:hypothetical protein